MARKQQNFTFARSFTVTQPVNYIPVGHFDIESEFRDKLLRKGFLVRDVVVEKTITVRCIAARANISIEERRKIQKEIDAMKPPPSFKILKRPSAF